MSSESGIVPFRTHWELKEARLVIRSLEHEIRAIGCFTSLTGGVLYKGYSHKDLDLVILPLDTARPKRAEVFAILVRRGWTCHVKEAHPGFWQWVRSLFGRRFPVSVWSDPEGRRIDVFVWR